MERTTYTFAFPAEAGTYIPTNPRGMEGWVGLGWLVGYIPKYISGTRNWTRTWSPMTKQSQNMWSQSAGREKFIVRRIYGRDKFLAQNKTANYWGKARVVIIKMIMWHVWKEVKATETESQEAGSNCDTVAKICCRILAQKANDDDDDVQWFNVHLKAD